MEAWENDPIVAPASGTQASTNAEPWKNDPIIGTQPQKPGFWETAYPGTTAAVSNIGDIWNRARLPDSNPKSLNPAEAGIQIMGQGMTGALSPVGEAMETSFAPEIAGAKALGSLAQSGYGMLPESVRQPIASAAQLPSKAYNSAIESTAEQFPSLGNIPTKHPGFQQGMTNVSDTAKAAGNAILGAEIPGIKQAGNAAINSIKSIPDVLANSLENEAVNAAGIKAAKAAKAQAHLATADDLHTNAALAINDTNNASKNVYGNLFDGAKTMAASDVVAAPDVKDTLTKLVNKISENGKLDTSSPFTKTLSEVLGQFDPETGEIGLQNISDAKKAIYNLYSDRDLSAGEANIYNQLKTGIDRTTARGAAQNPNWGKQMDFANDAFKSHLDNIRDNKTLGLTSYDLNEINNAKPTTEGAGFSPTIMQKVRNLSNIKDQTELESTLKVLPPEIHDAFLKAVQSNTNNSPSIIKTATGFLTKNPIAIAKNLWNYATATSGGLSPAEINYAKRLVPHSDVMKSWADLGDKNMDDFQAKQMNGAYEAQMEIDKAAQKADMAQKGAAQASGAQRALPSPTGEDWGSQSTSSGEMVGDVNKQLRYMTNSEYNQALITRSEQLQKGLTPNIQRIIQQRMVNESAKQYAPWANLRNSTELLKQAELNPLEFRNLVEQKGYTIENAMNEIRAKHRANADAVEGVLPNNPLPPENNILPSTINAKGITLEATGKLGSVGEAMKKATGANDPKSILQNLAKPYKRGGSVPTPAQIREINKKAKRTRIGRKV